MGKIVEGVDGDPNRRKTADTLQNPPLPMQKCIDKRDRHLYP